MAGSELYDVVVVAARAPGSAAMAQLAQTIAKRFGLSPGNVALGLDRGAVEIHRGLIKAEAIAATRALHELGAVAEVRAAREVSGVLTIEPDAEGPRTATAARATGGAAAAGLPPAPPFGVIDEPAPPPAAVAARRPTGPVAVVATRTASGQTPAVTRNPSGQVPAVTRNPSGQVPVVTRNPSGSTRAAPDGVPLDPDAPAISRAALGEPSPSPSASGRFAPPVVSERIELDLAAAGLSGAPVGNTALARGRSETSGVRPVAREVPSAAEASATSLRQPSDSMHSASMRGPMPALEATPGLLSADRVTSILLGATIGAVLGIVVAFGMVRGESQAACERLETELQASIADPIGVDEGRARAPDAIVKELDTALGEQRSRFLMIWALVALPLAGIGAIPKPGG